MKKALLKKRVAAHDNAKKVNPLDLSSDQDLTIGLMNMLAIEEICQSGDLGRMVHDIRKKLMQKIVPTGTDLWSVSEKLLAQSMRMLVRANHLMDKNKKSDAYEMYDGAYEAYSLFWGVNMGLVDIQDVKLSE